MSNVKLHPSTVWTLRTKKKLLEKKKEWRRRIGENYSQSEHNGVSIQKKGNTIADCLSIFNEKTEYGPLYLCTVCLQTCFKSSVYDVSKFFLQMQIEQNMFAECSKGFTSVNNKEWLYRTCHFAIKQGKVPRPSMKHGMGFPEQPPQLQLYLMEEHLISPVLIFFQMRCNPIGGQAFV